MNFNVYIKRPLCLFCISFITGIMLCSFIGLSYILVILALCLFFMLLFFNRVKEILFVILVSVAFFSFGSISFYNAEKTYDKTFDEFYNQVSTIEGYIDSEIEYADGKLKFYVKTNKITYAKKDKNVSGRLLVNVTDNNGYLIENKVIKYRTILCFTGNIEKPKSATNPGGFDYKRYLATIGVSGTVYLRNSSEICLVGDKSGGWLHKLGFAIKNRVLKIVEYCLDKNQAGLLAGMIIGYKDGLDENAYNAFSKAGLTHIMVASGMNIAFIILPLTYIFKKLGISDFISSIITIAVLILFVFITGFSASVVRAVIMGIIILLGKLIMRETEIYTSISAAAIILLLINPYTIFDIGFQLSFTATISLVMFYPKIKKLVDRKYIPNFIADTLAATIAAQVGVVPITLYYFNNFSTISILSNLLVVPMVQIITIIGFIMVFTGLVNISLAILVGYVNNTFLSFVLFITENTAKIPYASLKLPTPPLWSIVIYYLVVLYIFQGRELLQDKKYFRYVKKYVIYFCIVFTFIMVIFNRVIPKPLEITFLDIGQGDSAFIKTAHGTKVLIDGGGRAAGSKSTFNVGESVLVPFILDQGTKEIDFVVATHGHSDHTEGLESVLEEMNVGMVVLPDTNGKGFEKIIKLCNQKKIDIVECKKGDIIKLDEDTVFDVLSPLKYELDYLSQQSLNDSSLVLKLKYKNFKVLFQGDAEVPIEQRMIEQGLDLSADILKAGHHGSISSTSEDLVKNFKYKHAIISVGKNNFGHPSQFVLDRLNNNGALTYRTDQKGAIIATSYGEGVTIKTMLTDGKD